MNFLERTVDFVGQRPTGWETDDPRGEAENVIFIGAEDHPIGFPSGAGERAPSGQAARRFIGGGRRQFDRGRAGGGEPLVDQLRGFGQRVLQPGSGGGVQAGRGGQQTASFSHDGGVVEGGAEHGAPLTGAQGHLKPELSIRQ